MTEPGPLLDVLEKLVAAEQVVERYGIEIRVSELCPKDTMYVMDPGALDFPDDPARRVLVVPTEALAEQARKAAEEAGVRVHG